MHYSRYIKPQLEAALLDTPVVLIHGPRQAGKTTLAQELVGDRYHYVTFDDDTELAAARNDPWGFIDGLPGNSVLDEIQRVPELFPSIKRAVDQQRTPGRFLLTGSANILAMPRLTESLAGRVEVVKLRPLSRCEIEGSRAGFFADAFAGRINANFKARLGELLFDCVAAGGFPEPLQRTDTKRQRAWYANYLKVMVQKDIAEFANMHYADEIPALLQKAANHTASLFNVAEINRGLGFDVKTTRRYLDLLKQLFLIETLPPWFSNRNKRLIKTPKMHIADTGLLCALLKTNKAQLMKNRTLMGPVLETFVYGELRKQADWYGEELQFFHYRDKDQYEVDLVVQNEAGSLIGIEVKLAASVSESDFKGMRRFQSQHPDKVVGGYLLYDGERTLSFGDGLKAVPIQALWGPGK
ncbi:MAG: AAA family ATPase [Gammaproteobacteria bacterium]|nr:MAG: AAA family ATPase [Gammaproteobacteria bacterium]RLA52231.1 MAG: AAA family ATPase [Gammaproteobacteria bacterium]